jgi:3-methyladenine DNA glycosylase Mpg
LVRTVEPIESLEYMLMNGGLDADENLTDKPGKLTQTLETDSALNREDLVTSDMFFVEEGKKVEGIGSSSSRVGIRRGIEFKRRFFVKGNRFFSKAKPLTPCRIHN